MIHRNQTIRYWILPIIITGILSPGFPKEPPPFDIPAFLHTLENPSGPPRDLTPDLLWLAQYGSTLPEAVQNELRQKGFQLTPTRTALSRNESDGLDQFLDTPYFRIHYTLTGLHAVDDTDLDVNTIPDYVDLVAAVFDSVFEALTQSLGYTPPPGDAWVTTDNGGNGLYDIYLRSIYPGYYGYTQAEYFAQGTGDNENSSNIVETNAFTSYMALRNSYTGFPGTFAQNIRVTAAHEFFHAIQFGYDGWEEIWLLEATAVWMEEVMYDNLNDCYQYMPSWFNSPETSLDANGTHMYGSYIFFRYLEENWSGRSAIRSIFESSIPYNSQNGRYDFHAIRDGLAQNNLDFRGIFNGMVIANRILAPTVSAGPYHYREAESYPVDGPKILATIHQDTSWISYALHRYSSQYVNLDIDHPVRVRLSSPSGANQNVKALGIVKSSPGYYSIYQGWDIVLPSSTYADWISLALSAQDTIGNSYGYTVTIERAEKQPDAVSVYPPYPNPATKETSVHFTVQVNDLMDIQIKIIDVLGHKIATLFQGTMFESQAQYTWSGKMQNQKPAPSGIYFLVAETASLTVMSKFTWLK